MAKTASRIPYCLPLTVCFLIISLGIGCETSVTVDEEVTETDVGAKLDDIMQQFASGHLEYSKTITPSSGWTMTTEAGRHFRRSVLRRSAQRVISLGPDVCDELIEYLEHERMEIRYIAAYSLEQVTGKRVSFPTFVSLEQVKADGWKNRVAEALAESPARVSGKPSKKE